jgi:uncharacterized RDD family membrane protein YckC
MSNDYEQELRNNFANMHTDMLIERKINGGLTDEAKKIIEEELAKRNIKNEDIEEYVDDAETKKFIKEGFPDGITMLDLASVWRRYLAQFIDQVIGLLLAAVVIWIFGNDWVMLGVVAYLMYVVYNDALPNGQSYGKYLLQIKVISEKDGEPCKLSQSFFRNITTLIPLVNLVDSLMIFGQRKQRLGDVMAKTLVVNTQK